MQLLICKLGYISFEDEGCIVPSSDFYTQNGLRQVSTAIQEKLFSYVSIERQQELLTLINATKVNYFNANHHTGQRAPSSYIREVIAACPLWAHVFLNNLAPGAVHPLHQVGRWASTKDLFRAMGIPDVLPTYRPPGWPTIEFRINEDLRIRLRSMPAGCAKLGLVVAGARALLHSDLARFVPRLEEISPLKVDYDRVLQRPLLYHMGAKYLTGRDQNTGPKTAADLWLGRIGTFIYYVMKGTTLASSPLIAKGDPRAPTLPFRNCADFSGSFENICKAYMIIRGEAKVTFIKDRLEKESTMMSDPEVAELIASEFEAVNVVDDNQTEAWSHATSTIRKMAAAFAAACATDKTEDDSTKAYKFAHRIPINIDGLNFMFQKVELALFQKWQLKNVFGEWVCGSLGRLVQFQGPGGRIQINRRVFHIPSDFRPFFEMFIQVAQKHQHEEPVEILESDEPPQISRVKKPR
uniref:Uncharacterized protein n=1 Tax=Trichuris muris TaxID=70415 RepID=A0A5S6QGK7_TRIMR